MSEEDPASQIEFAKWIIDHNQNLINLVDAKAAVILAADGAILALLAGSPIRVTSITQAVVFWMTLVPIGLSALFGFMVIKPRTISNTPPTKIFFGSILSMGREDYRSNFPSSRKQILDDCANNVYALALIQKTKFAFLRRSLYCLLVAIVPLVGMVIWLHLP